MDNLRTAADRSWATVAGDYSTRPGLFVAGTGLRVAIRGAQDWSKAVVNWGAHGEEWANKINIGIRLCTYNMCRDNKRKEFMDGSRVKEGLTRYVMAGRAVLPSDFAQEQAPGQPGLGRMEGLRTGDSGGVAIRPKTTHCRMRIVGQRRARS